MDWILIITTVALVAGIFKSLDYFVSDDEESALKNRLFIWWCTLSEYDYFEAAKNAKIRIHRAFEVIYGEEHLSLRCFVASSISSLFALFLCLVGFTLYWGKWPDLKDVEFLDGILFWVILNLLIDYISLIETRWLISSKITLGIVTLSIFDILLSIAIYFFFIVFVGPNLMPFFFSGYEYNFNFMDTFINELDLFIQNPQDGAEYKQGFEGKSFYGIFGWSTLFTSFLLQAYVFLTLTFKLLGLAKGRIMVFLERIESSNRTFTAFGAFLSVIVGIGMAVIKIFSVNG